MKEIGKIVAVEDNMAVIRIHRSPYCSSCGACKMGAHRDEMELTIPNLLNAEPGDYVELDLKPSTILKASAIIYIIPLLAMLIGVVAGYWFAGRFNLNPELYGAVSGVVLTILTYVGIRMLDPVFRTKGKYSPQMISIVNKNMKGEDVNGK